METEVIKPLNCLRCGHKWWPNKLAPPVTCPKCRSPYWARKRTRIKSVIHIDKH